MFFDSFAVLLLTFFASLGMVEAGEWLLKNPFRKDIKKTVFVVAKVNSVPDEDIEPALRTLLSETEGQARKVFLDCSGASESATATLGILQFRGFLPLYSQERRDHDLGNPFTGIDGSCFF